MTVRYGTTRRVLFAAGLGLTLLGCDDEASRRKAFIVFLQTRILDKPGVHVARPTVDEEKGWGDYARHYAIITGFNDALSERVSRPMQAAVQRGTVRSLQEVLDRRADLRTVAGSIDELVAELNRQLAAAEAARAALNQPPDLKPVFDAAFERDVAGPARAFLEALPVAKDALDKTLALADLLDGNRAKVKLDGALVQLSDPVLQREIQTCIAAMNEAAQRTQVAQRRLQALITGS